MLTTLAIVLIFNTISSVLLVDCYYRYSIVAILLDGNVLMKINYIGIFEVYS